MSAVMGSPAVVKVKPSSSFQAECLYHEESDVSAKLRLLAMPMKVSSIQGVNVPTPATPPGAPVAKLSPSGASAPLTPPGTFQCTPLTRHHSEGSDCSTSIPHAAAGVDVLSEASVEESPETCTTMAVLNIPYTYPKWKLQRQMEMEGYSFNYFHFPRDSRRGRNRGFAFVNFTTPEMAQAFCRSFNNMTFFHPGAEEKIVTVVPSSLQGFESNRALHPTATARPLKQMTQRK